MVLGTSLIYSTMSIMLKNVTKNWRMILILIFSFPRTIVYETILAYKLCIFNRDMTMDDKSNSLSNSQNNHDGFTSFCTFLEFWLVGYKFRNYQPMVFIGNVYQFIVHCLIAKDFWGVTNSPGPKVLISFIFHYLIFLYFQHSYETKYQEKCQVHYKQ